MQYQGRCGKTPHHNVLNTSYSDCICSARKEVVFKYLFQEIQIKYSYFCLLFISLTATLYQAVPLEILQRNEYFVKEFLSASVQLI